MNSTNVQPNYSEIGQRIKSIRIHFSDFSQKDWAEKHSFNPTQYNNWERGTRRIPVEAAIILAEDYSVTLDFIYQGKIAGLPQRLAKSP